MVITLPQKPQALKSISNTCSKHTFAVIWAFNSYSINVALDGCKKKKKRNKIVPQIDLNYTVPKYIFPTDPSPHLLWSVWSPWKGVMVMVHPVLSVAWFLRASTRLMNRVWSTEELWNTEVGFPGDTELMVS